MKGPGASLRRYVFAPPPGSDATAAPCRPLAMSSTMAGALKVGALIAALAPPAADAASAAPAAGTKKKGNHQKKGKDTGGGLPPPDPRD